MKASEINRFCERAANGRGGYVFANIGDVKKQRIIRARTRGGVLQVLVLSTQKWEVPNKAMILGVYSVDVYID